MVEYDKYRVKSKEKPKYVKKRKRLRFNMWKKKKKKNKGVALENKIGQQKSTCVGCDSKNSTF